jgi:hypothetical protein
MAAMLRNEIGSQETPLWMPWATLAEVFCLGLSRVVSPVAKTATNNGARIESFPSQVEAENATSSGCWTSLGLRINANERAPRPKKMVKTHRGKV